MSGKNSIRVGIKVRPLFKKEKDQQISWRIVNNSIQLLDSPSEPYCFDHIFDQDATNQVIFDTMAKQIVHSALQGFNGTIFAYGQTSSGKTYTMMGDNENPGVMVLAAKEIFNEIERTQDRQFLLRVGYIEIYNEKICDLLNKKNQDLKIHETSTGIVSVNCEEFIIRTENDLLNHLDRGGKERTVGETNMNERSSRSHAIFRIIIESRKIDRSGDDAVIQSVINLVDLAGSERADQSGARGTRLKEGGHINKSLLFLSNVIKSLSENADDDKYISFRDSKLTRILQASLGGNALTAIICTIKPNAIEETQSTLNFALRAKKIKNKPEVNEIVSDATMMKRLEEEIKLLKMRLQEEQQKNESQIKVRQLEQRIKDEDLKIISCNSLHSTRNHERRRRTWCPSSNLDTNAINQQASAPGSAIVSGLPQPTRLQVPKTYNTPLITMRPPPETPSASTFCNALPVPPDYLPNIEEEFAPAELVNFEMMSPLQTPKSENLQFKISITPKLTACPKSTLEKVEHDLYELQKFTDLENKIGVKYEPDLALKQKVEALTQRNAVLENERMEYLAFKTEFNITTKNLTGIEKSCKELEVQLNELTNTNKIANQRIVEYEAELAELKKTNEKLEMENREAVKLEFEFKSHKNKSKLRETELLEVLDDKEKEIKQLEKSYKAICIERLQCSREELLLKSVNERNTGNEDGKVCIKCEDLQNLLDDNKKNTLEFEKLTLEYEKLKLNYSVIEEENERNKLKIVQLEELQQKEKANCERLLLEVQQLSEKLYSVERDYKLVSQEKCLKDEECLELNVQIDLAKKEMLVLEEKFSKLELSWQEQKKTLNDIEIEYAAIQKKYKQLQYQYEQLEVTKGQSLTDYQCLAKENINLQTDIKDLKNKVKDAQQKLLESNAKYEETPEETRTTAEELSKIQQENAQLQKQFLDVQQQLKNLQQEYDDLSNQLIDNLQENEQIRNENNNLQHKLKAYEEIQQQIHLKTQLENVLSSESKNLLKTPTPCENSSLRSSGVCVENYAEDFYNSPQSEDLLKKFYEIFDAVTEIELELTNGRTKVFKSAAENLLSNCYKMYLKNILGVQKPEEEFLMEIENVHLQGSFKPHSFHIVKLCDKHDLCETAFSNIDMNGCANKLEYVQKLQQEIIDLKAINEEENLNNKSLLDNTQKILAEMKEQITQLSSELMEKSMVVDICSCKVYQQQIDQLTKEKADLTILHKELQDKFNNTFNGSFNGLLNNNKQEAEIKDISDDKLKELKQLQVREQELLESYNAQTKTLKEITQRCNDMEAELDTAREQLKNKEKEFEEKYKSLRLNNMHMLQLSDNEFRNNKRIYIREWQRKEEEYEHTIDKLKTQIDILKRNAIIEQNNLKVVIKEESSSSSQVLTTAESPTVEARQEHREENQDIPPEDIEAIKQDKCRLQKENLHLQQLLNTAEETVKRLEKYLIDASDLHPTVSKENSSLETQLDNIKEDLNCIPELHDKNPKLSDRIEKLNQEIPQLQDKFMKTESESHNRERNKEQIPTSEIEKEERKSLSNDFENLKLKYKQVQNKLLKAEEQIQEFYSEDAKREEFVQTLQAQLCNIKSTEEENNDLKIEIEHLKEKEMEGNAEIENLKQKVTALNENLSELIDSKAQLDCEKTRLKENLQQTANELKLLQSEKCLVDYQLGDINEELKTVYKNLSTLDEEKINLMHVLKETQKLLKQLETEKSELVANLQHMTEQFSASQNQLEEKEKHISYAREQNNQILKDLQSLAESIPTITEENLKQLEEAEREKEKHKEDNYKLSLEVIELKENLAQVTEEKGKQQQQDMKVCEKEPLKRYNYKLNSDLVEPKENLAQVTDILELRKNMQLIGEKFTKEQSNLQYFLKEEQKKSNSLEIKFQTAQQENNELQQKLKVLNVDLLHFKESHQNISKENAQLKSESEENKESLIKFEERLQHLQDRLSHYQELQLEKSNLEVSLTVLRKAQAGALTKLQEDNAGLQKQILECEKLKQEFKEREETTKQKNESLQQQLHELRAKVNSYERLLLEHEEMEYALTTMAATNQKLQQEISRLSAQEDNHVNKVEYLSVEVEKLNLQLVEKQALQTKLSFVEKTLQREQSCLQKDNHELKSSLKELQLKHDSLQETNIQLETLNQDIKQQLDSAKEKLREYNNVQEELKTLKVEYSELQHHLKKSIDEAERCSLVLGEDLEHHKQLLQKEIDDCNTTKSAMETKQHSLNQENLKLSSNIAMLQKEKLLLEDKLRKIAVGFFEQDLQRQAIDGTANCSTDFNNSGGSSNSPRGRKSLEEQLVQQKNLTAVERKNRRLSTHDERRRQSYWGISHDKETMTDSIDINCNCIELDGKLKECQRNLFIKNSQVTALNMELKNHPLKEENANLKKRLQEELDKHRNDIKRYKTKLQEQNAKTEKAIAAASVAHAAGEQRVIPAVVPKVVANAETQTAGELNDIIQKLQSKYNDIKNICRYRYNVIKELEERMAQKENADGNVQPTFEKTQLTHLNDECDCDSLRKEHKILQEKYEFAKKVLQSRREEIINLKVQLEPNNK